MHRAMAPEAVYRYMYTPFGGRGSPSKDGPVPERAPVVFGVDMGDVLSRRSLKKIKKKLMEISGVVEVCPSFVTGHIAVVGMTEPATLKALLETELGRPAVLIRDFGAVPAPPVGGGHGMMPPPGAYYYNPHVSHNHPPHAAPPPQAGYYGTSFGGRPWGPPPPYYRPATFEDDIFEDEDEYHKGRCCSIQ